MKEKILLQNVLKTLLMEESGWMGETGWLNSYRPCFPPPFHQIKLVLIIIIIIIIIIITITIIIIIIISL